MLTLIGCGVGRVTHEPHQHLNMLIHRLLGHDTDVLRLTLHDKPRQVRDMAQLLLHEPFPNAENSLSRSISQPMSWYLWSTSKIYRKIHIAQGHQECPTVSTANLILQSRGKETRRQFKDLPDGLVGVVIHDPASL